MTSVFTIKLTHMNTGASMIIPINNKEFKSLTLKDGLYDDHMFVDIMSRSDLKENWYDYYEFDGIFLGTIRKD